MTMDMPPHGIWMPPKPAIIRPAPEVHKGIGLFFSPPYAAGPPPITYPTVNGTPATSTHLGTNHSVTLPSGITAGELLLIVIGNTNDNTPIPAINTPAGWTELLNTAVTARICRLKILYKTADGSEGGSQTVTKGSSYSGAIAYRIGNWGGTPEIGTSADSNTVAPNPPSVSPSWGTTKGSLFLPVVSSRSTNAAVNSAPSGYSDLRSAVLATGDSNIKVMSSYRELHTSSEDPGNYNSPSNQWIANTIAIRSP